MSDDARLITYSDTGKTFHIPVKILFLIFLTGSMFLGSCENKIETIRKSDIESLPTVTIKNLETTYSDSARKQLVMVAPLLERYTNRKDPYDEFRFSIKVIFHDGRKDPVGSISAKYGRYEEEKKLWELRDSVVAVNFEKNEVMETELLYWEQGKDLVYTDRFVKMTSEDQVVMGTGFESDPRFNNWKIRNVSASFYVGSEE